MNEIGQGSRVGAHGEGDRVLAVLELARWAPSGDNTQPWRFEIVDDRRVSVHGHDTRDWCVYDLEGRASQISLGALLESIRIAASGQGMRVSVSRRSGTSDARPVFDLVFDDSDAEPDPRLRYLTTRAVQRRPLSARRLEASDRQALEAVLSAGYSVRWVESRAEKLAFARLMFSSALVRLTCQEAFEVHRRVIEWGTAYSDDKLPEYAIGVDRMTGRLMRWAMQDWSRVRFLNRYLAGTWLPRLQLDLVPAMACGAHFVLLAERAPTTLDDFVAVGGELQRFWLEAERLGIRLQPESTPLIFTDYVRRGIAFTSDARPLRQASAVARRLRALIGDAALDRAVFMGRLGYGPPARARSHRLPLSALLLPARGR